MSTQIQYAIIVYNILFQFKMGSNYWISWAIEQKGRVNNKQLMGTFALLSFGGTIFILGRIVLRAHVSFFDTTPSSQITNYCYLLIIISFNKISTILLLMIIAINGSKYCRHRHTIQISWTSVCTYLVNDYHCANVPSCMASHSAFFCSACNFHLVSGKNCVKL
ncbi:hypothetical protein GmHk_10G028432 [Glycine max]|nr:hypothetical protein GmHk_10G028432 [Glycine max]